MRYDTAENLKAVREQALVAAREAIETLNRLEAMRQPSDRLCYSLRRTSRAESERERVAPRWP